MFKKIFYSNHVQSAIAQFGSSMIAIVSFMILARTMPQVTFGEWGLFLTLSSFFELLKAGFVATGYIKYSSGASQTVKEELKASSWILNLGFVLVVFVLNYFIYLTGYFDMESIILFLLLYPLYTIAAMPYNYFIWNSQIELKMNRIAGIKIFNAVLFLTVCISSVYITLNLQTLVLLYISSFALSSLLCLIIGDTGIFKIILAKKSRLIQLLLYGRFQMLAFLGSNLLRSSDIFLISAFLGPKAVAIYLIPQRLWIMVIMPLASAIRVGFPIFSANHNSNNTAALKYNIEKYIGGLTLLYIPFACLLFISADYLVLAIGGDKYMAATILFRIFLIYSIFVPFDQIIGIALDAVDKPDKNFIKVTVMTLVNIIGDLIVLFLYKDIELVAWVTLATILSGSIAGYIMLRKIVPIKLNSLFKVGYHEIKRNCITFFSALKTNRLN
ncbi:MAG: oligosaccharide flippase family protein [Saprospiraceae bacterium]|nr:oligosaccharide flippase family protein [Saprospiraceae bacterium]